MKLALSPFCRFNVFVALLYLVAISPVFADTPLSRYKEVKGAFFDDEMLLSCGYGGYLFRVKSSVLREPKVLYRAGLGWSEVPSVEFLDSGFRINGFSAKDGVPLTAMSLTKVYLPVFSEDERNPKKPIDYLLPAADNPSVALVIDVDLIRNVALITSAEAVVARVTLNASKYQEEQSAPGQYFRYKYGRRLFLQAAKFRQEVLPEILERFKMGVDVPVPQGALISEEACELSNQKVD